MAYPLQILFGLLQERSFLSLQLTWRGLLEAVAFVVCAATAAGFSSAWPLELAAHFRVQYLAALTLLTVALLVARRVLPAVLSAAFAALNLALIASAYLAPSAPTPALRPSIRLMLINVYTANRSHQLVLDAVRRYEPDAILFEEVNSRWLAALASLSAVYPFHVAETREDNFGVAFFSKLSLDECSVIRVGLADVPSVLAKIRTADGRITFVGTHALPPGSLAYSRLRNDQLARLAEYVRSIEPPVVLLGDLNTSAWSRHFVRLLADSALRDSGRGWGWQPTWPTAFWPLLVPIDHCLHSERIRIVHREVGPFVGSDHYPLIVDARVES